MLIKLLVKNYATSKFNAFFCIIKKHEQEDKLKNMNKKNQGKFSYPL